MPRFDPAFEQQIAYYRRRKKLLVARNISFRATSADFKSVCRDKLSRPGTVRFFWPAAPVQRWRMHQGFVMLAFDAREDCDNALSELQNLQFRSRAVDVKKASKSAYIPLAMLPHAANTPAADTSTANLPPSEAPPTDVPTANVPTAAAPATETPATSPPISSLPTTSPPATTVTEASTAAVVGQAQVAPEWAGVDDDGDMASELDFDEPLEFDDE